MNYLVINQNLIEKILLILNMYYINYYENIIILVKKKIFLC